MKTPIEYFLQWENQIPDKIFLKQPFGDKWETTTWKEAGIIVRKLVSFINDKLPEKNQNIGILSKNCREWILADLAIMMSGNVSVPMFPNISSEDISGILKHAEIKILFLGKLENWDSLKDVIPKNMLLIAFPHYEGNDKIDADHDWNDILSQNEASQIIHSAKLDELMTILYTSGTTGKPKGVMLNFRQPTSLVDNEKTANQLKLFEYTHPRFFSYLPLNHIAERNIVEMAALATGGSISFVENLTTFRQNLVDTKPNVFIAVPRIWTKFQQAIIDKIGASKIDLLLKIPIISGIIKKKIISNLGLDQAAITLTGAAPMPNELLKWYQRIGLNIREVYAMTENCGGCSLMPENKHIAHSVGTPLKNVDIKIDSETGEVLMKAPWIMTGYYKDDELTSQVLQDGYLRTGDQGYLRDGYLFLTGRVKDTFKTAKGEFINPVPIELELKANTFIEQIAICGLNIAQPIGLIRLSELASSCPKDQIRKSLETSLDKINSNLSNFQKIKSLVLVKDDWTVENRLSTPTLKTRRNEIHKYYKSNLKHWFEQKDRIIWEN